MIWAFGLSCLLAAINIPDKEIEGFLAPIPQTAIDEAASFIESTTSQPASNQRKCSAPSSPLPEFLSPKPTKHKLFLFTSFSLPLESWTEFSIFLEKAGGMFVLQGLPDNSFTSLAKKLSELRKAGIRAEIVLDPESFEKFNIRAVPTLVLSNGKQYDKISGNIKPLSALSYFAESGDCGEIAKQILQQAEGQF